MKYIREKDDQTLGLLLWWGGRRSNYSDNPHQKTKDHDLFHARPSRPVSCKRNNLPAFAHTEKSAMLT
jgi:hypothetical protein